MTLAFDLYQQGILLVPTKGRGQYQVAYANWREKFPAEDPYLQVWAQYSSSQPEVLCGSGDVVAIDVDEKNKPGIAAIFDQELRLSLPDLYPSLYVEKTASGGMHYFFKRAGTNSEDIAFAPVPQTLEEEFSGEPIKWRPIIEIKGENKLCRIYPCEGIEKLQGDILALPVVSDADFQHMRYIASLLNEREEEKREIAKQKSSVTVTADSPGNDYSNNVETTEIVAMLERHGWRVVKGNAFRGRILLNRPGAKTMGTDADILDRVFCVWSSSVDRFDIGKGYSFFSLYGILEHGSDFVAAAKELKRLGWGKGVTVEHGAVPERSESGVAVAQEGEMTLWDEVEEEIRKSWDESDTEYTLTFRHQQGAASEVFGVAAPGMIVLVTGREKARKSAYVSAILSANLAGSERCGHTFSGDGVIIYIDTEQSKRWIKVGRERLMVMGGLTKEDFLKRVVYIPLVGIPSHEKRLAILREAISRYDNIAAVVMDGGKDFVEDDNDLKEAKAHIGEFRAVTRNRGFILFVVLHLNKQDRNVSGHLGSHWTKACDIRYDLILDDDTGNTNVSCPFIRGERIPPFSFRPLRGNIPQIDNYPKPDYDYQGYFPPKNIEGQIPDAEFAPPPPFALPSTTYEERVSLMGGHVLSVGDLEAMNQKEVESRKIELTDEDYELLYGR